MYTVLKRFDRLSGSSLPAQPRRYLERALLRRRKLGLDLPRAEDRKLVAELSLREKDLGAAYEKNLAEDNTTLEFTPEELGTHALMLKRTLYSTVQYEYLFISLNCTICLTLQLTRMFMLAEGVPSDTLGEMERSADGTKIRVTLQYPHYFPVMRFCKVRATRAALERAFNSRCVDANVPILHELIRLRHKVLPFAHYRF